MDEGEYTIFLLAVLEGKNIMKRKRLTLFTIIFVGLLFFGAIWKAFLVCIVPQTRVRFRNFEAFRDKAENSGLSMSLPDSQDNLKYYYHVEWFQYLSGFSVSLSDDDYKQMIESCIEEYQSYNDSYEFVKYYYQYNEKEVQYAQENVLEKNGITFFECLLLEDEEIKDFYYIAVRKTESIHEYYTCVLANDTNNRIMELSYRNTNPQYDK